MPEDPRLTPAAAEEVEQTLAFALRFDGRKRAHSGDELMARLTTERLVKHLEQSGFVVMRKPPSGDLSRLQSGANTKP
jgi:Holliday junction resolvase